MRKMILKAPAVAGAFARTENKIAEQETVRRKDRSAELELLVADSFWRRFLGLMGRSADYLPLGTGLLLAPCNSIHMLFMRFPIDVIYVDKSYRILKLVHGLSPWLGLSWCLKKGTWGVIECPVGTINKYNLAVGQQLQAVE